MFMKKIAVRSEIGIIKLNDIPFFNWRPLANG